VLSHVGKNTRKSFIGKENDKESELGDFGVRKYVVRTVIFLIFMIKMMKKIKMKNRNQNNQMNHTNQGLDSYTDYEPFGRVQFK
jgi:hypothetical protein